MLIRLLIGADTDGVDLHRSSGMYVAFIASAVALAGAVIDYRASGGTFKDLTDLDSWTSTSGPAVRLPRRPRAGRRARRPRRPRRRRPDAAATAPTRRLTATPARRPPTPDQNDTS